MDVKRHLDPPVRGSSHLKTTLYISQSLLYPEIALSCVCASGAASTYLSLSATKMTRRSSRREAKMRMICRTLRHLNRHSKSTCSRRESMGLRSSMTWTQPTHSSQHRWARPAVPACLGPSPALQHCPVPAW